MVSVPGEEGQGCATPKRAEGIAAGGSEDAGAAWGYPIPQEQREHCQGVCGELEASMGIVVPVLQQNLRDMGHRAWEKAPSAVWCPGQLNPSAALTDAL